MSNVLFPAQSKVFQVNTLSGGSLTTSLVSYWAMEGNSGDFFGTNYGTDTSVSYSTSYGKVAQGASFSSSLITTGTSGFSATNFSVSMWFRPTSTSGSWGLFDTHPTTAGALRIYEDASTPNQISYNIAGYTGQTITYPLTNGTWYHFVYTLSGGNVTNLYINGVSSGAFTNGGSAVISTFTIGTVNGTLYSAGAIDEVGVWSKVLSTNEISDLYNGGAGQTMVGSVVDTVSDADNTPTIAVPNLGAISVSDFDTNTDTIVGLIEPPLLVRVSDIATGSDTAVISLPNLGALIVNDADIDVDASPTITLGSSLGPV
jgi:hypothetical protein